VPFPVVLDPNLFAGSGPASSTTNNQQSFYTAKVLTSHIPKKIHPRRPRTGRARVSLVPSPLLVDVRHGCKPCPSRLCPNPISCWFVVCFVNNQQSFYTAKVLTSHIPKIHLGRPRTGRARVSLVPPPLLVDVRHGCKPCPSRLCPNPNLFAGSWSASSTTYKASTLLSFDFTYP